VLAALQFFAGGAYQNDVALNKYMYKYRAIQKSFYQVSHDIIITPQNKKL
jgi:hypothetical protein